MAWTKANEYKTRSAVRRDDTLITSHKPLDNGMPSSPVPFITPSGLVTFQHDLKARIASSPLVKVSLIMRPLIKKRTSIPFTLGLKRHSMTVFSRSSSSSDASGSAGCTPGSELADPISMTEVVFDLPCETTLKSTVSRLDAKYTRGDVDVTCAKIVDRFWPEEETYSEESCHVPVPVVYPAALAPPPHYRRASHSPGSVLDAPVCQTRKEQSTDPLRFPF